MNELLEVNISHIYDYGMTGFLACLAYKDHTSSFDLLDERANE
jgi:hypothetical protein